MTFFQEKRARKIDWMWIFSIYIRYVLIHHLSFICKKEEAYIFRCRLLLVDSVFPLFA